MITRRLPHAAFRRQVLLVVAATLVIVAIAAAPVPAWESASGGANQVHTVAGETRPDGTRTADTMANGFHASASNVDADKAICSGHQIEHGDWINADPNARGIARIELRDCQAVTTCNGNICSTTFDAGWRTHVFGKCSPTNCDWGWSAGTFRLSSGHIYGFYDQGFAKRHVYAMMSQYRPGQLWVYWRTDFTDPNRADYDMHEWFVRA
jgi:hypothetical protein